MKYLHLGDLHLGKSLGDFNLKEDQSYILKQIVGIAEKEKVDGVLIAGDVYDKSIPSEEAVNLFNHFVTELSQKGFTIFMISGNHDSDERLNFGSKLLENNKFYISSCYDGNLYKRTFTDSAGELNVYLLPFVKASQVRYYYPEETIENYDDAVRVLLEKADIDPTQRNILVAHQYVVGDGVDPMHGGSEGLSTQMVGNVEKIRFQNFDAFDYVALGHIHSDQGVGRDTVRYSGSPLKYSLSEVNHNKSVPIITMGAKGDVTIELVPLKPLHDMRHIKGTLKELQNPDNITGVDDYIYVTLAQEEIVENAMGIMQKIYKRTLKVDYENSHSKELEEVDFSQITSKLSFDDLFSQFYNAMYGCEMNEEEIRVMKEIAREAGISDETN